MTNYSQLLKEAREQNLDIAALDMAYEMECCLDEEVSEEHFNIMCERAFDMWLKFDYSKCQCCHAVIFAYFNNDFTKFCDMDKYELSNYIRIY